MRRPRPISIDAARPPRDAKLTEGGWIRLPARATQTYIPIQAAALAPLVGDGLLRGGLIVSPAGLALHRPLREDHLLVIATQAATTIALDGKWSELPPGHACHVAPGQTLTLQYNGEGHLALARFAFSTRSRFAAMPKESWPVSHAQLLVDSLRGIFALHGDPQDRVDMRLFSDYVRILRRHLEMAICTPPDRQDAASTLVWQSLIADPSRRWLAHDVAEVSGLHPRTLARRLRERFGCSLQALLVDVRMQAAETLLCGSHVSLDAIASQVGYADAFAFSKAFKRRHNGVSPAMWRDQT